MIGQTDDLQKLVVLNNDVVMQMVQFVGCLHAVQSGTVAHPDYLTRGDYMRRQPTYFLRRSSRS